MQTKRKGKKASKKHLIEQLTKEMLKEASNRNYVKVKELRDLILELETAGEINV